MSGSRTRGTTVPGRLSPLLRGLAPILPAGPIRALVLGPSPSVASLGSKQYYGNPHNWFWRVLAACGVIADAGAPYGARIEAMGNAMGKCGLAIWDRYGAVRRPGSGNDAIRDAVPNPVGALFGERVPFSMLLNGRRERERRRHFAALAAEPVPLPSTSPRPLHWNTAAARAAAFAEWCAALRAAGVATPPDPVP